MIDQVIGIVPMSLVLLIDDDEHFCPAFYEVDYKVSLHGMKYYVQKLVYLARNFGNIDASSSIPAWYMQLQPKISSIGKDAEDADTLMHFIDWIMQLAEEEEARLFEQLSVKEESMGVIAISESRGMQKGKLEGELEGTLLISLPLTWPWMR